MSPKVSKKARCIKLSLWIDERERKIIARKAARLGVSMSDAVRLILRGSKAA
jgi:antitoxin component of RelBE/YafQ-DinJ toxin-antitoxin module